MKNVSRVSYFVLLLCVLPTLVLTENFWWEKVKAVKLSRKTFDKFVGTGKYAFLEFYSKSCTYCEQFYPQFNQIFDDFMGKSPLRNDLFIGKVDGEEESGLARDLGISIYPTFILLFPDDATFPNKYMFDRKYKVMKEYLLALPKLAGKEGPKDKEETEKLARKIKEFEKQDSINSKLIETLKSELDQLKKSSTGTTTKKEDPPAVTPSSTPPPQIVNGVTSEQLSKLIKSVKSQKRGFEKLAHRALEKLREASEDVHSDDDAMPLETKSKTGESSQGAAETKDKKADKPEVEKSPNATSAKTSVLAISFGFGIVYILAKFLPVDSVIDN